MYGYDECHVTIQGEKMQQYALSKPPSEISPESKSLVKKLFHQWRDNLYEKLDKSFSCVYNDNIIKIDNIFIENYKCIPLSNVKSDKIIFYTICTLNNNIFSLIDCYYSMCHNKSNILLYIIGLYNDNTLSILEKINF